LRGLRLADIFKYLSAPGDAKLKNSLHAGLAGRRRAIGIHRGLKRDGTAIHNTVIVLFVQSHHGQKITAALFEILREAAEGGGHHIVSQD
jgi:hypothetical protein